MSIAKRTRTHPARSRGTSGGANLAADSRARSRSFKTKREAQDFEGEIRRVQRLGAHAPGEVSSDRLEDWLKAWFTSNRVIWAPSTTTNRASASRQVGRPVHRRRAGCAISGRRACMSGAIR